MGSLGRVDDGFSAESKSFILPLCNYGASIVVTVMKDCVSFFFFFCKMLLLLFLLLFLVVSFVGVLVLVVVVVVVGVVALLHFFLEW